MNFKFILKCSKKLHKGLLLPLLLIPTLYYSQTYPDLEMGNVTPSINTATSVTVALQKDNTNNTTTTLVNYSTPSAFTTNFTVNATEYTNAVRFGASGAAPYYTLMNILGNAGSDNGEYTSNTVPTNGTGLDIAVNHAMRVEASFAGAGSQPGNGRIKLGEITITLGRGTNNPHLHFKGLGGTAVDGNVSTGITAEFTVKSVLNSAGAEIAPGTILNLLSGTNLSINPTLRQINNDYTSAANAATSSSGRGTVRFENRDIKTIILEVFGNRNGGSATAVTWSGLDAFYIGLSAAESDLEVTKFVSPSAVSAGDQVVFTVNAKNNGASHNTNVIVDDILPSGYTYISHSASPGTYLPSSGVWNIGTLNDQVTATLTVTARAKSLGMYNNEAAITTSSALSDPDLTNNSFSVAALVDSDRDGVADSEDLDDDNDGIPDTLEGFCASTPTLLKTGTFSAIGAGAAGRPTINFEVPTTGSGRRTVLLLVTVERDHTPSLGGNWESTVYTAANNTSLMPDVTFGTSAMEKRNYNFAFDAAANQLPNQARLSRTQYVYALSDSNAGGIPNGTQNINLTNFVSGLNAGDEFTVQILVYDQVRSIEVGGSNVAFANTSGFPSSITVSNNTNASQSSPLSANDVLLAFGGNSNGNGMTLSSAWTPIFNSKITNGAGTYTTFSGIPTGSSENDGLSTAIATITGVTGTQSVTFNFNTNNALLGNATMYRLNGYGSSCTVRDTDGDGISDFLDLDSDNDGCVDALEGAATITSSQLATALGSLSVGTGSAAANQNLPAPVGNTPTTKGIPQVAGTGQAIGTAIIANLSPCYIDAKNDINQTPLNTAVAGFLLTNDVSGEGAVTLSSAQVYNASGVLVALPVIATAPGTGTATSVYTATGTLAGTIRLYSTGEYRFVPATGFVGTVPVNYTAANAVGGSDTAQLEIQVIPVTNPAANDAPVALNDTGVTKTGITLNSNVLGNDSDPDTGNTLTVTGATQGATVIGNGGTAVNVTGVNAAGATVTAGTFALTSTGNYAFTPETGFVGTVNPITYTISDGNGGTDTATVNIEVKPANAPPVVFANDDAKATVKGVSASGNMLTNDSSTATGTLSVTSVTISGTAAAPSGAGILISGVGTVTISSTGAYTFLPLPTFVGTYVIPYTTCNNATPTPFCSTASLYLTSLDLPGYCYKEPITTATRNQPVKHGITALNRAGSGSTEWPTVRQGAWTVLEAKTKGFVINRTTFVDEDSNPATPPTPPTSAIPAANYVEGMIMYDNGVHCLKVYTGAANGWQCYNTQACPDF